MVNPELRAPTRRPRHPPHNGLTGGRIGLAIVAGAAAWIGYDLRYQRIAQDAEARVLVIEFETALEKEIRESNARRFELADYLRNATER